MNSPRKIQIAVGAMMIAALAASAAAAAPLFPVPTSAMALTDAGAIGWNSSRDRGGVAAGLAAGLIIGGLLAAPRYYNPYPYYYGSYPPRYVGPIGYGDPGWEVYCFSRYRSFDPISGTYLGRDGRRHYCR